MEDSDIEDGIPTIFNGKGRKLPAPNVISKGLAAYFAMVNEVPNDVKNIYYAHNHLNVEEFINMPLPKQ